MIKTKQSQVENIIQICPIDENNNIYKIVKV